MASNPMQKKARNSFLLGVIITLVICILIAVLFYFLVISKTTIKKGEDAPKEVKAYALTQDVLSGQIITPDLLQLITVYDNMIPSNYVDQSLMYTMELQDKEGNILYTKYVKKEDQEESEPRLYIEQENVREEIREQINQNQQNANDPIAEQANQMLEQMSKKYVTVTEKEEDFNKILIQEDANGYYRTKINGQKEYVEFLSVPIVAKINMNKNTIVTTDAIAKSDEVVTDDLRYVEYNMLTLPTTIFEGDYIDIRLTLPNGQDLIVVSKKEVKSILGDTIGLRLTEGEILMMESAIVESYIMTASKLYAIQYVDPGLQQAAVKTYTPTDAVQGLIQRNGNIVETAKAALLTRFNADIRTWTNTERNEYLDEEKDNLEEKLQLEIENARAAREAYLSGLTSY